MGERIPLPASSALTAITYDQQNATLDVEFRHGETYRYFMVPQSVVEHLISAPSAGRYFSEEIRPRYQEHRLA